MKFKAKRTGRRTSTRVVISGDERDPQGIWDRLLGFFSNLFTKLFGKIEYERTVIEPDEEIEFEGSTEELLVVKEASEGLLRTTIQATLEQEASNAEKKKLENGRDPRAPAVGTAQEQFDLMVELQEYIDQKRKEGYTIKLRTIAEGSGMADEAAAFTINKVVWNYQRSRTIGSNEVVAVGVRELDVQCNKCPQEWTARSIGKGAFTPAIGAVHLTCPNCGNSAPIPTRDLGERENAP